MTSQNTNKNVTAHSTGCKDVVRSVLRLLVGAVRASTVHVVACPGQEQRGTVPPPPPPPPGTADVDDVHSGRGGRYLGRGDTLLGAVRVLLQVMVAHVSAAHVRTAAWELSPATLPHLPPGGIATQHAQTVVSLGAALECRRLHGEQRGCHRARQGLLCVWTADA